MTLADKIVVLKDGEVMQVGAPMDLFNLPANEFVAGFLGSPKMNFFDGTLSDVSKDGSKAKFSGDGFDTKLVRLVSSDKKKGDKARLGIRPQHLHLNPKGKLVGRVLLVEKLGTETIIELVSKNKTSFRFTSPDIPAINIGEEARFSFDAEHAHLF
jgi:multiple sugar transport system ATP-binding protein